MSGRAQPSLCACRRPLRPKPWALMSSGRASWSAGCCPGETGPSGGPAMTDVLGDLHRLGRRRLRGRARVRRPPVTHRASPTSCPASRCRRGRRRGCGSRRARPRSAASRSSPTSRCRRSPAPPAGCCAPRPPPPPAAPTRSWPSPWTGRDVIRIEPPSDHDSYDVATVTEVERHYAGLGKPAVAAVLGESDERSFLHGLGWVPESHDADTLFQLASVASVRRSLRSVDHSGVVLTVDGGDRLGVGPGRRAGRGGVRRRLGRLPRHRGRARPPPPGTGPHGHGRAAGVGGRARRHHGVPPGARAQRAGAGAVRARWASRPTTPTRT